MTDDNLPEGELLSLLRARFGKEHPACAALCSAMVRQWEAGLRQLDA